METKPELGNLASTSQDAASPIPAVSGTRSGSAGISPAARSECSEWQRFAGSRLSPVVGFLIVMIALILGAIASWRRWPDVVVDYGQQLYLPWRIAHGAVLYRDVSYMTGGPLSQYFNAGLFRLFGTSLMTLVLANFAILAGLLVLLYRRFLKAADSWTATLICLGLVLGFAFAQDADIGNYNFITPYCHEIWHGVVLSIVSLTLLSDLLATNRNRYAAAAGVCAGMVFLTKPEVFTALAVCAAVAFVLLWRLESGIRRVLKSFLAFLLSGLLPPLAFLAYFRAFENWGAAFRSICYAWVPLLGSSASQSPFYKWCLGLDAPGRNIGLMFVHFAVVAAATAVCAVVLRRGGRTTVNRIVAISLVAGLLALASGFDWIDCGRSLPLLTGCLGVYWAMTWRERSTDRSLIFPTLWTVFGFFLLAKLGLFSRIWHYGFALAMPAFVSGVYLLHWLVPLRLERHGIPRHTFRLTIGMILLVGFLHLFAQHLSVYRGKTTAFGRGADRIFGNTGLDPGTAAVAVALPWIEEHTGAGDTLASLPDGTMVNYLSRRVNPTHHLIWNPVELAAFGQDALTQDFRQHPPDYILLLPRDTSEFGVGAFGRDPAFGLELRQWIERNYDLALEIPGTFGPHTPPATIWKHSTAVAGPTR